MLFGILAELLLLFSLTRRDLGRGCSQVDSGPWKHIDTVKKIRIYIFYMPMYECIFFPAISLERVERNWFTDYLDLHIMYIYI